ncbi:hypothetical protein PT974_08476 [Cladobotryum mycophilum]|uniref:Serine/threonine-protein kinase ppk6 n=1 Tax=Cladobotryum mycophilum TaxID=491253 RepID=A0ABR0SEJ0_9HYPO
MSADLFAEFANGLPSSQQATSSTPSGGTKQLGSQNPLGLGFNGVPPAKTPSPIEQWPSFQAPSNGLSGWTAESTSVSHAAAFNKTPNDDDDGWGDFETAENTAPPIKNPSSDPFGSLVGSGLESKPKVRLVRAPTIDLMTNTLVDVRQNDELKTKPKVHSSWEFQRTSEPHLKSTQSDSSVLFDADDFELQGGGEDDEFGDFETVAPAPSQSRLNSISTSKHAPLLDLLSLDDPPLPPHFGTASAKLPNPPKSPSFQERNPFPDLEIKTSSAAAAAAAKKSEDPNSASPVTAWPPVDRGTRSPSKLKDDDDWGAWDNTPSGGGNSKGDIDSAGILDSWDWEADDSQGGAAKLSDNDPPPTNVPPPSVILSMFPDLLASGNALFKPISGQNASIKQKILSTPKAVEFLEGYILLATTAARVIAGRKQRWHRDKILAKSMSISAAGSKGMKLAGVDKAQSAKEDREAADVVAVWREQVGRLRSAVTAANTTGKASLKVPELSENMHVQTAKMAPTSPKACIICGLKRDERISKVDHDIEDSFGEWWTEHWGHRSCKNFWIEHEQKLRQR